MIKVFGHKAPDTDATASAIIWAWYLEQKGIDATPYVLGDLNTEAAYVIKYWDYVSPEVLKSVERDEDVIIVEIIDHHLMTGGLKTKEPIKITIKPLASTATIMAEMMGDDLANAPREIKGLILSCIISDTLEFRSPTTTSTDIELAKNLSKDLELSLTEYAQKMFEAKSNISQFSDKELLRMDSKEYEVNNVKMRISVLETTSPDIVLARKDSLIAEMKNVAKEDGVDQVLLFVVDILNEQSNLLIPNQQVKDIAEKSFKVVIEEDIIVLPGVVSRKKQIIPNLVI